MCRAQALLSATSSSHSHRPAVRSTRPNSSTSLSEPFSLTEYTESSGWPGKSTENCARKILFELLSKSDWFCDRKIQFRNFEILAHDIFLIEPISSKCIFVSMKIEGEYGEKNRQKIKFNIKNSQWEIHRIFPIFCFVFCFSSYFERLTKFNEN